MALSADFIKAVDSNDTLMTRIMLKDSMLVDLTLNQFKERLAYAESKMSDLYDEHDGEQFSNDITEWDKDMINEQMVKVVTNFSKERIAFLQKLVRTVYAQKAEQADRVEFVSEHKSSSVAPKAIGAGVAACGAVAAVVGIAASQPVIVAAGVAGVVVGGAVIIANK